MQLNDASLFYEPETYLLLLDLVSAADFLIASSGNHSGTSGA